MRVYRNSLRYWLQAHQRIVMPSSVRPFNRAWRFVRSRDEAAVRRLVVRLREVADGLEYALTQPPTGSGEESGK